MHKNCPLQPLVVANWKQWGSKQHILSWLKDFRESFAAGNFDAVVCPPAAYLTYFFSAAGQDFPVLLGAQNVAGSSGGAYTGEIGADMLQDTGCSFVIVGHSERRKQFGENDALVGLKLKQLLARNLIPILCVGENRQHRARGQAQVVVCAQIETHVEVLSRFPQVVVAYEPVWAIGAGVLPQINEIADMQHFIGELLFSVQGLAEGKTRILYGGSVDSSNCRGVFTQTDFDGVLVGSASLSGQDFSAICAEASKV